ncbi:MAG: DNA-directed RNA polymerase subunit beta [Chloroflexi bacterium]|nr:DNA-directed RNA polymerase subunit beta [Chloroflexota bacterium]
MKHYYNVKNYARTPEIQELPSLIDVQKKSFEDFFYGGRLKELFDEINPIQSFNENLSLYFPGNHPEAQEFDFSEPPLEHRPYTLLNETQKPKKGLQIYMQEPKYDEEECIERDMSYAAPLYVQVALVNHEQGDEIIRQYVFLGEFPLMTEKGTFIINGTERVVVSQLIRSPGVYFDVEEERATGRLLSNAKMIPDRGAWMEFETKRTDYITIKFNRKRTIPVTVLLRALAAVDDGLPEKLSPIKTGEDEEILALFADVDTNETHAFIQGCLKNEPDWTAAMKKHKTKKVSEAALIEFFNKMRPGDPEKLESAREYLEGQLFDQRRYDLERVGRYKLNQRLGHGGSFSKKDFEKIERHRTIIKADIVKLVEHMIRINNGDRAKDDIDHLGNRRVKTVGELIGNKLRIGLRRMERVVKERMSIREAEQLTPISLVNIRPIVAAVREFFGSSQLSQFMEQTNPLSELTHKRTLSALGPGGLRRERAGFDVRDVHHSHYGRICPIETPEGPNIGLIGRLASYARVNELGFIETPYRRVVNEMAVDDPNLIGRVIRDDIENSRGKVFIEEDTVIDKKTVTRLKRSKVKKVPVIPFATHDITYLSADDEDKFIIAQANARLDDRNQFISNRVSARFEQGFVSVAPQRIDYMDIAPRQIVGISAALIPFLSHDAANRALMGSNMQRQAVPLITPDVSVVSTGMERQAASDSGQVLMSDIEAEVISVQGHRVIVRTADGAEHTFQLRKYERSNQSTCIDQRPVVHKGDWIKPGDIVADSSSTYDGHLALGHDVLTCFLSWDGGNYEDALLVSEDMLRNDKFTSIHIEKHEIEARDTKLGPEEINYDIPNVGEEALRDLTFPNSSRRFLPWLDSELMKGVVRVGTEVGPNDILVGKITPKGEKELSPEEKLLRAIFGEQAREVRDSSLRLPHGDRGKVIETKMYMRDLRGVVARLIDEKKMEAKRENSIGTQDIPELGAAMEALAERGITEHADLSAGVEKMVRVSVAQRRKLTVGDKMAGRHGNKGVISKIVTVEDMPYIEGGVPVEIILNPLGVPSRMNIGQILELHLGWAADRLGFRAITPVFDGVKEQEIQAELGRAWMIDWAWKLTTERAWESQERLAEIAGIGADDFDDDMHVICAYLVDRVGESGLYDNEAIILERDEIYVRRVAVAEMLREFGYDPDAVMVYDNSELSSEERDARDANAIVVSIRLWIQHHARDEVELSKELSARELFAIADRVMFETNIPVPHYGKHTLYDGRTGEPFDRHVAVGYVHMLKLAHLVEDKAHARSTGPYSLVTQQPLGGKAQFGGQRFGEMEVWALEAYGAAHILQEMLTVKSDDVQGRVKTYESIVKGEPIEEPGIPTSFRVLVKELQSLGLSVEAITGSGDVIRFGKYDEQSRKPQPETGLLGLGTG